MNENDIIFLPLPFCLIEEKTHLCAYFTVSRLIVSLSTYQQAIFQASQDKLPWWSKNHYFVTEPKIAPNMCVSAVCEWLSFLMDKRSLLLVCECEHLKCSCQLEQMWKSIAFYLSRPSIHKNYQTENEQQDLLWEQYSSKCMQHFWLCFLY